MSFPNYVFLIILTTLFTTTTCQPDIVVNRVGWRTYTFSQVARSFQDTQTWCDSLGGKLPSIHSQEDLTFLIDQVIPHGVNSAWIGLKKENRIHETGWSVPCHYVDGSDYDFDFKFFPGFECSSCSHPCCSLKAAPRSRYPNAKVWMEKCDDTTYGVCVREDVRKGDVGRHVNETEKSVNQTIHLMKENMSGIEKVVASLNSTQIRKEMREEFDDIKNNNSIWMEDEIQQMQDRMEKKMLDIEYNNNLTVTSLVNAVQDNTSIWLTEMETRLNQESNQLQSFLTHSYYTAGATGIVIFILIASLVVVFVVSRKKTLSFPQEVAVKNNNGVRYRVDDEGDEIKIVPV